MPSNLPTGTVTFLSTDIQGSTQLAQQYTDALPALLARHHAILHGAIQAHNGYVFQIIGDSFHAAFHTARDALLAALEAQTRLVSEPWNPAPVKVRMGIHTGAAQAGANEQVAGGYAGYLTLTRVERVMSAAHGGQILLSNASAELVRGDLPPGVTLRDLREHRLKGLVNLEHLWQVDAPALPHEFPPLVSLVAIPNNLPQPLTSFVGRERELAEITQWLATTRLLTLTGSGGTGKTRLSLQAAARGLDTFPDGVWFVELAPLIEPELVPQTILTAIGIGEQAGRTPLHVLEEYVQAKRLLLILDNCEHLIQAAAQVANALLHAAAGIHILASSREGLGIQGERLYPVPSLSLPDPKQPPDAEHLLDYEAVRLFVERARLAVPQLTVNAHNAPLIAQICYRLDGIPLALELAAARVRMMSVEQIAERLDDRFHLLTGGSRTALPRQQTLRALIDWSYDLLSENERRLLRRLAVFAGGWTLEAAEQVCAAPGDLAPYEVLDLLAQLVNKSLVVVGQAPESGETRYRLLETIRQYAREKLLDAGDSALVHARHLAYFTALAQQAAPELYRSNQVLWFSRLDEDLDNLRAALEWSLATEVRAGLVIAAIPWRFWSKRNYTTEIEGWLRQLLSRYPTADPLHAQALAVHANCFLNLGDLPEMIRLAQQSLQMANALSDPPTQALSLSFLGVATLLQGNVSESIPLLQASLALYRRLGDKMGQADVTGWLSIHQDDLERAIAYSQTSLALLRELGNRFDIAERLTVLARLVFWSGDFESPAVWLQEARTIAREIRDQNSELEAIANTGVLAYWKKEYAQAHDSFNTALALSRALGNRYQNLWVQIYQAYAFLRQGDIPQAQALFENSLEQAQQVGLTIALVYVVEGLASLKVEQGQIERAAQLFAWSDAMRERIGDRRPPVEQNSIRQDVARIQARMDDAAFARFTAEGSALTTEQAAALATNRNV